MPESLNIGSDLDAERKNVIAEINKLENYFPVEEFAITAKNNSLEKFRVTLTEIEKRMAEKAIVKYIPEILKHTFGK